MTGDEYIEAVLARHELKPTLFSGLATSAVVPKLREWAGPWLNEISYVGSIAKGTGISGTTDIDIFISLKSNTPNTLEEIYNLLTQRATALNWSPRQQNVSVGITYMGVKNGTARLQTVSPESNRHLHELLVAFKARTGYGVLCNTSLNFKGRGFINEITDLSTYTLEHGLDGFVVDGRAYLVKSARGYQAYLEMSNGRGITRAAASTYSES